MRVALLLLVVACDPARVVPRSAPPPLCPQLAQANAAVLDRARHAHAECGDELEAPALDCHDGDGWAWGERIDDVAIGPAVEGCDSGRCSVGIRVALVHRARDGTMATMEVSMPGQAATIQRGDNPVLDLLPLQLVDLDHDHDPEVLVTTVASCNAPGGSHPVLVTYRGGRVVPYPPAAGFAELGDLEDVDGDGQLDLWTSGPYDVVTNPLGPEYPLRAFFLAHGTRDGQFVFDDVARAQLRDRCDRAPDLPAALASRSDDAVAAVICARAHGASERDVVATLDRACKQYRGDDHTLEAGAALVDADGCARLLVAAARTAPPLHL